MASTYSTNLAIELIGTGDQAGSWGNTTNTNLGTLIEQAISGYVTQAVATGTDTTITIPNGATGVARNMYIELTGTGGTNTNLIVPANKKLYFIFNNSTGAVTVKVSGQTGVSVPQGKKVVLTSNGTDVVNGLNYIADFGSNSATITQLTATSATITNLTLTSLVISNLSIASANITTLTSSSATISTTLALSGGTANGVLYLNGSKVATSGSALVFDGTNLGLGTSSNKTTVVTGGATGMTIAAVGAPALAVWDTTDASYVSYLSQINESTYFGNNANGPLYFQTNAITRATLDSSGNLGIGTTSPSANSPVHINKSTAADCYFRSQNSLASSVFGTSAGGGTYIYNGGAYPLLFYTNDTERMRLDSSGNLGIGTTPSGYLANKVVISTGTDSNNGITIASATNRNGSIWFADGTTGDQAYRGGVDYQHTTDTLYLYSGGQGNLQLNSSGNLGLGVTPSAWGLSGLSALQIKNASFFGYVNNAYMSANEYNDSAGTPRYIASAAATRYVQSAGTHAWNTAASGTAGNAITFTQAMTLDANGNLVLGTTSALSSSYRITSYGGRVNFAGNSDALNLYLQYNNGTLGAFIGSPAANVLAFSDSNGTERARIDASGNLLVGATSQVITSKATILSSSDGGVATCLDLYNNGSSAGSAAELRLSTAQSGSYAGTFIRGVAVTANNSALTFGTEGSDVLAERGRFTAGGYFKASDTGTYFGSTGAYHELRQTTNNICVIASSSDANYSSTIYYADTTRAANAAFNLASWRANNVTQFEVSGAGVIYAQNTTVQSLSDGRLKENVSDATDGLSVINALRPVRYDWKAGYGNDRKNQLGFIAQEMETVFPDAVAEWKVRDDEEAYKTVGPGALIPVLVKAMQEQQAMINELKAKVAALEA